METKMLDVLEDIFDISKHPPRLYVKLSSLDGKLRILTEVKHNSPLTKYFAEQSRNKSPALSSMLDDLYSKAESDSSDSGVALGDLSKKAADSPAPNGAFSAEGEPSYDQMGPKHFADGYHHDVVSYNYPPRIPSAQQSAHYYHEQNQQDSVYHRDSRLEKSYPDITNDPSWHGPPPWASHPWHDTPPQHYSPSHYPPPPIALSPYYPMWPYPQYSPYGPRPADYRYSPSWPTQFSPEQSYHYGHQQMAAATAEETNKDQGYSEAVSHEAWSYDTVQFTDGHQEQLPSTEGDVVASETSDTSNSSTSSESCQTTPHPKYGYIFASSPSQSGETNFRWVEMASEDNDAELEYNQFARESGSSSQQYHWSRAPANRLKRLSGGSASQLDMISEESNDDNDDQDAASEASLTLSSEVSEDRGTLTKEKHNGNVSPQTPGTLSSKTFVSKSLTVMEDARMVQRAALSSKSMTCLPTVKIENPEDDQHCSQPSASCVTDSVQAELSLGHEAKSCQPLTGGVEEAHNDGTELNEREQSLLDERAELEQQLQDMHARNEEAGQLLAELECLQTAIQTDQEEFRKKMADLDKKEKQQLKQLDKERLNWEEKLHELDTSNYDESTLELDNEDQRLNNEAEALESRQKEIDDMHESIQMKEKATAALRERVTQVETEVDQCVREFDERSQEAEEEMARQKALLAQRDSVPKRKLSDLRKNIMRLKKELEEVQSSFHQKSESAAQLQSDVCQFVSLISIN
jgi:hypothetical protein